MGSIVPLCEVREQEVIKELDLLEQTAGEGVQEESRAPANLPVLVFWSVDDGVPQTVLGGL